MVFFRVYSEPVVRLYYSTLCSRATLFKAVLHLLILVPPAFIAYATNGLWRSVGTYREQPDVLYLNQCIIFLGQEGGSAGAWSSLPNFSPPPDTEELARPTNITFSEEDTDGDGKNDALDFNVDFSSQSLNTTSLQLLLFFTVKLSRYSSVDMQSVVHISHSGSSALSSVWVGGDLVLNQRTLLRANGRSYSYGSVVNTSSQSWQDYQLINILREYNERDITTVLHPAFPVWEYAVSGGGFIVEAEIKYTEQTLLYSPAFWERLKWAWVQYLAIAIVFWYFLMHVQSFVFENHVIPTFKPYSD